MNKTSEKFCSIVNESKKICAACKKKEVGTGRRRYTPDGEPLCKKCTELVDRIIFAMKTDVDGHA